jgi:hypothetical protein
MGRADGLNDSGDGAYHHYTGMGRTARLPDPLPQRPAAVIRGLRNRCQVGISQAKNLAE